MKSLAISLMAALVAASPVTAAPMIDGGRMAEMTEARYAFHCGGALSSLELRERVLPETSGARLADRRRVEFVTLSVGGRNVSPADQRRIRDRLHLYAWLNRVEARCSSQPGEFELHIEGMPAQAWADFNTGSFRTRPGLRPTLITVSGRGIVTIS
jgi:hypothetical protein